MKINKKAIYISILISTLVLSGYISIIAISEQNKSPSEKENTTPSMNPQSSQFAERTIRVAIYNEPNTTRPAYDCGVSTLNNNFNPLWTLLYSAGYEMNELTVVDISAHKLTTASYDVLILADNLPRENITNLVKEFWLGGGGILSFDSAINYINYAGMIPPEAQGTSGRSVYWEYISSDEQNITTRHPVTKAYNVNDSFSETSYFWATFDWNALQTTSVASDLVRLATQKDISDDATVVALDPSLRGGRVVQMLGDGNPIGTNMGNLIIDAVDWLCPRPKGRILFDLSHHPFRGIDPWDSLSINPGNYEILRNNLVNRSYTIDKLYPSASGNLTTMNLAHYDMLIMSTPFLNFTNSEITVIANWINSGGSLFAICDQGMFDDAKNINYLISSFDLSVNLTAGGTNTIDYSVEHPTIEGCTQLSSLAPGLINYTGDAYPIWGNDANNIVIAAQEYGIGRVILMADDAILRDDNIYSDDNLQYGINVVNWLSACQAEVLVYVNHDPNNNYYRGPVATALNDLSLTFYLTFELEYFNMSLTEGTWTLVIFDHISTGMTIYTADILNYMKTGGRLIISDFSYRFSVNNANELWSYIGFKYAGNYFSDPQTIYVWNKNHPILTTPALYSADNISTTWNYIGTDCTNLTLYSNATAIAGLTANSGDENAAIIIGADGRAITNAMMLTEYYDDTDNSTYPDALEIWENEIAFIIPPRVGLPSGDGDDDGGGGGSEFPWLLLMIIIGAIIGVIALVAIILILKKKR